MGEIYDEADQDVRMARVLSDGSRILPGTFPVHDLVDVGIDVTDFPGGDYTTIAGLVLSVLGRIPTEAGDHVEVGSHRIDVTAVDRNAITEVRVRPRYS